MYYRLDPTLEHAPSVFLQRYVGIAGLWAPLPYFPSVRLSSIFVLLQHATEIAGPPAQRAHNLRSLSRVEVVQVSSSLQRSCTVCGKALVSGRVHLLQCSRKICKVYSQNNSTRIGLGTCLVGRSSIVEADSLPGGSLRGCGTFLVGTDKHVHPVGIGLK